MNSDQVRLSHANSETSIPRYSSKICSPTKRTLNNKNYLAEDASRYNCNSDNIEPITAPVFTQSPKRTINDSPNNNTREKNNRGRKFVPPELKFEPIKSRSNLFNQAQQTHHGADTYGNRSPTNKSPTNRSQKSPTQHVKSSKVVEIHSTKYIAIPDANKGAKCLLNRYFSKPDDFNELRQETGKLKPIISIFHGDTSKKSKNSALYKLDIPVLCSDKSHQIAKNNIETNYRVRYQQSQPLYLFGDTNLRYSTLEDLKNKDMNSGSGPNTTRLQNVQVLDRQFLLSSANDSLELSFDGKALDRSDIFRMVDSFSVAFSDEDDEDSPAASANKNVLPWEMTNSVC